MLKLVLVSICLSASVQLQLNSGKRIRCPPLPFIENGRYRVIAEKKVKIECDPGYVYYSADGSLVITCDMGIWSNAAPTCYQKGMTCPVVAQIENGQTRGRPPFTAGSRVSYLCNEGYVLDGASERTCQPRIFQWTGAEPTCAHYDPSVSGIITRISNEFDKIEGESTGYIQSRNIPYDVEFEGLDLFLVFDKSNSIQPQEFAQGIAFAKYLIERFNISNGPITKKGGTRLSVITFGDHATEEISLTDTNIDTTKKAQKKLDTIGCKDICDGSTNLAEALAKIDYIVIDAKEVRPLAKKALFLTSDGIPDPVEPGTRTVDDYAQALKDDEVEIFSVGIGQGIDEYLLRSISSKPSIEHVFLLKQFNDFKDMVTIIREKALPTPPPTIDECGYLSETGSKVSGEKAGTVKAGAWPWLAAVIIAESHGNSKFSCSGALVCKNWVLTSALCLKKDDAPIKPADVYVILAEDNLAVDNNNEQYFYAEEIIFHEEFQHTDKKTENDLALIKLNTNADLGDFVRIPCLPARELISSRPGTPVMLVGWLTKSEASIRLERPIPALEPSQAKVNVLGVEECRYLKMPPKICLNKNIGTASVNDTFDSRCAGDRGSLVMADISGRWTLIGMVSRTEGCSLYDKFVIFTRIKDHWDWIRSTTDYCSDDHDSRKMDS